MKLRKDKVITLLSLIIIGVISIGTFLKSEEKNNNRLYIYENDAKKELFDDRWSADLINGELFKTTSGFSIGIAEYSCKEFGKPGIHEDQEAIYIISGEGEYMLGDSVFTISPGYAIYVPPGTKHAVRRTTDKPVKLLYAHGAN